MGISGYLAILRMAAKFTSAYSVAIKAEELKDGDVNWIDYLTCVLIALQTMDAGDLDAVLRLSKQAGKKK